MIDGIKLQETFYSKVDGLAPVAKTESYLQKMPEKSEIQMETVVVMKLPRSVSLLWVVDCLWGN